MRGIWLHKIFASFNPFLPVGVSSILRSIGISLATPIYFSLHSGHWLSSIKNRAVDRRGRPIPWYSYPAIDFLSQRSYADRTILEFGAGQSTLFWAKRCSKVLAFEGDVAWFRKLVSQAPPNVDLKPVSLGDPNRCLEEIQKKLSESDYGKFDLIVIDGLYRREVAELSMHWVKPTGAIVVDNAEGYGFFEAFKGKGFQRVDFFGHAPGILLPHCTSIYFKASCFLFDASIGIPDIAFE